MHIHKHEVFLKFTFTFMHLTDAFIQSDLQCTQGIIVFVSMYDVRNVVYLTILDCLSLTELTESN